MNIKHKILVPLFGALALMGTTTSCSDFLDEHMKSTAGPDNVYTSTTGFETAATGLYTWARDEFNTWGGDAFAHGQACPYEALQVATDIVFVGAQQDGSLAPFEKLSYTPSTTFVSSYWKYAFGLIASSNEMLEYAEKNKNWDKATDAALYQATVRFFRAYAYRYLVYLYGDVPYVDKIERSYRTDFTRTPKAEVMQHMIDDLKFAAENLPEDPDAVAPGKLTKWAALHLLSEVYLMHGDYAEAKKAADDVITSGYFELMQTRFGEQAKQKGDAFHDLFCENNQNRTSGNKESIWVMQFEYNTDGGGGDYSDWTRRAWNPKYYNVTGFVLADSLGGRGLAQIQPLTWWIEGSDGNGIFEKQDMRNSEYNIKRHWYYNDPAHPELLGKEATITDATRKNSQLYPVITKFFYGKEGDLTYTGNSKDRMRFRLAETYLLKAEACIRLGDQQGAADAINAVRRRAGATEVAAANVTMDYLLDERIRELVGEEIRRFTLQRTGKQVERVAKYNDKCKDFDDHNVIWPIPQNVIDSNTGAEFPQNPNY